MFRLMGCPEYTVENPKFWFSDQKNRTLQKMLGDMLYGFFGFTEAGGMRAAAL
jgi:hypothetical protein